VPRLIHPIRSCRVNSASERQAGPSRLHPQPGAQ